MKKQLLFVALSALMGGNTAFADTSLLTSADGWTKITSISQDDIANNYYVFVDNDADLMLGLAKSSVQENNAMFYQASSSDITNDLYKVWVLEKNGDNYGLRNLGHNQLQLQTEYVGTNDDPHWRQNDQPASCEWTGFSLAYADGKWTLTSTKYGRPLGVYNDGTDAPAEGTEIGANAEGKGTSFQIYAIARDKFLELYKSKLSTASEESPRNATLLISNPDFNAGNATGWEGTTSDIKYEGGAAEFWHPSSFDVYQTLTGLSNGKYQVSMQVVQQNVKTAQLYATTSLGTTTATVTASPGAKLNNWTSDLKSNGVYFGRDASVGKISVTVNVTNGNLTLGLKDADPSNHWVVFDNFTMSYLGAVDVSEYVTAYETALTAAKSVDQESPMQSDALVALVSALASYSNADKTSVDALVEATGALNTAATAAASSVEAYAKAKTILENTEKFINSTNFYTAEAIDAYTTNDYTTPKKGYDERTLTNEEIAKLQDPYVKGAWKAERNVWAVLRSTWSDTSLNINTWSTEGDSDGSNFVTPFVEWWTNDDKTLAAETKTGTLGGLTAGKVYEVAANVRVRKSNNQTEVKGISMDVNGGASVDVCDGAQVGESPLYLKNGAKAYGLVGEDGNLNVNFTAADGNTISWIAFKDVKYTATDMAVLDEDGANTITSDENANIGLKRLFTAGQWNSVVLPLNMTSDQVQALFGEGTKTAEYTGAEIDESGSYITLDFTTSEDDDVAIKANTPCLVRPAKNVTFAVVEDVEVVAPESDAALVVDDNLVNFAGTYSKGGLTVTDNDYYLAADGELAPAKEGETVKAFGAIFRLSEKVTSDVKFLIAFDRKGDPTYIQNIDKSNTVKFNVYNLAGQMVKRNATSLKGLQKGLYVVNGKKVVVD